MLPKLTYVTAVLSVLFLAPAAQAAPDVPLSTGYVTDGAVTALAFDSSGRTYLGGRSRRLARARGAAST